MKAQEFTATDYPFNFKDLFWFTKDAVVIYNMVVDNYKECYGIEDDFKFIEFTIREVAIDSVVILTTIYHPELKYKGFRHEYTAEEINEYRAEKEKANE